MKKAETIDDLRPEYDVSQLKGGIRGKYAERLKQGSNIIRLEQDVAAVFQNDQDVDDPGTLRRNVWYTPGMFGDGGGIHGLNGTKIR